MRISGLAKSSTVDYPGLLSCVVFTPGCNYDCFFCHNRELLEGHAPSLEEDEVLSFLRKRAGLLDAVVVSGGEPTLQPEALENFLTAVRSLGGYRLKLDTNGSHPDVVAQLLARGLLDYVAMDYKAPFDRYPEIAGAEGQEPLVRRTLALLRDSGLPFELRTTVVPQLEPEDLLRMLKEIGPLPRYVLQLYRKPDNFRPCDRFRIEAAAYTPGQLRDMGQALQALEPNTIVKA
jgi:pyruvate formate lyase activating enzyme